MVTYDRRRGEIIDRQEFSADERTLAFAERLRQMIARRGESDVEVVLFTADSFDDLKKTHSRYFKTPEEIFAGIGSFE